MVFCNFEIQICGETVAKIAKQSGWQQGVPARGSAWALVMCSWRLLLFAHFTAVSDDFSHVMGLRGHGDRVDSWGRGAVVA